MTTFSLERNAEELKMRTYKATTTLAEVFASMCGLSKDISSTIREVKELRALLTLVVVSEQLCIHLILVLNP